LEKKGGGGRDVIALPYSVFTFFSPVAVATASRIFYHGSFVFGET
jgi:hypothetical protein